MFKIPPLTSDIIAISLDGKGSPSININLPETAGGNHSDGWGFGWYPEDHSSAIVTKDPAAHGKKVLLDTITDWSNFRSTVFFCKVRGASKGYTHANTQPFLKSFAGRDWVFMHNGDVDIDELRKIHQQHSTLLEPVGNTDSELIFCDLLSLIDGQRARKIGQLDPGLMHEWFKRYDAIGSADMYLTDGASTVCFHGTQSPKRMYYSRIQPPENQETLESEAAGICLNDPQDTYRTALIVSSTLFHKGEWAEMKPGQMVIIRRGAIVWDSHPEMTERVDPTLLPSLPQMVQPQDEYMAQMQAAQAQVHVLNAKAVTRTKEGESLNYREYEITHRTEYEYTEPVQHSTHMFRLQPIDDPIQEVDHSQLTLSCATEDMQYEDVFGNHALHCVINEPYSKLTVEAKSRVKIYAMPPDDHSMARRQTSIPLVWMPWQRQMMMPYLLPSELPESQLSELTEYAMSFVERNDYHLLRTIRDINASIYRDYKYVSGSTSNTTTPFNVYTSREGVCQDFANLFICLARLLSIPARYRMGYIYTGANYENTIQSEASHAWIEVYLPYLGWRGFDPTNGCVVGQEHIRVACGRNYRDATPTSGTIYKGGGTETLSVDVKIQELHD